MWSFFPFGQNVGSGVEDGSVHMLASVLLERVGCSRPVWGCTGQERAEMRLKTSLEESLGRGRSGTGHNLSGKDGISVKSLVETHSMLSTQ